MPSPDSVERGAQVRFPPPVVFLICILIGVVVHYAVKAAPVPFVRSIGMTSGLLLVIAGVGLIASARTHFVRTGQHPAPWRPSPELILNGPYRFTRNPMYLGMVLFELGLGLLVNNLWISLLAIPAIVTVHFIAVLPEERYLAAKFGDSYRTYLAHVRRYV